MDFSKSILEEVSHATTPKTNVVGNEDQKESREALDDIQQRAKNVVEQSEALLRPFTVLSDLIAQVFQYKGIRLADPVTLGEAREAIASDVLSSGEKQMLSFLCYNAFTTNSSIFIDEPEISLHVDWQRILFPILIKQSTGNQFIVATHSPFIYSKYSDKELLLSSDRGDDNADAQDDRV
jgi:ABC-type lipoprotein export system ATPase subunit